MTRTNLLAAPAESGRARGRGLRGAFVAAAAVALALAVPGVAHAADYVEGDYDGIEISVVGNTFALGAHNHDPALYPDFDPAVDRFVTDSEGIIHHDGRKGLEVGIASEAGVPANAELTLTSAHVSVGGSASSAADVEVTDRAGVTLFNTVADGSAGVDLSTEVGAGAHVHPNWIFKSGSGVYTLTFSVSAPNYTTAAGYTLTFVVP